MDPSTSTCEITESGESFHSGIQTKNTVFSKPKLYELTGIKCGKHVQNDLIRLFEALDIKAPSRVHAIHENGRKASGYNSPHASGIGVSQPVNLKQAFRRLCVSQASEMAATKRLSKAIGSSGVSEAGTIKRLYAAIIVEAGKTNKEIGDAVEISLVPEEKEIQLEEKNGEMPSVCGVEPSGSNPDCLFHGSTKNTKKVVESRFRKTVSPATSKAGRKISAHGKSRTKGRTRSVPVSLKAARNCEGSKSSAIQPSVKPTFKSKCSSSTTKDKPSHSSFPPSHICCNHYEGTDAVTIEIKQESKKGSVQESSYEDADSLSCSKSDGTLVSKSDCNPTTCEGGTISETKIRKSPMSITKGDYSQSSKSSLGDFSSCTSISIESNNSSSSGFGSRPHMSRDVRWTAIQNAVRQHGSIGLKNFMLLKRLGCGDIGTVYLAELTGSECLFALKIMDNEYLASRKKMLRADTEREILQMLDHPFLPTLYTHFISDNLSCLVMEFCPGGDLHVLRQQQPGRCFTETAARFYVAEVLLALEYLHMLGVIYRDLKPENILVREDGHIMLSDFDLSLRCSVNPILLRSSSLAEAEAANRVQGPCAVSSCIDPLCLQPSCTQVSCFTIHPTRRFKDKSELGTQVTPLPQLVAEPTEARSNSFVGTHEYLAPEIIKGEGHGSSVDWWTFGIFLYELLFSRTPFKGPGNEETLANIVCESLMFPECPSVSFHAIDLIRALLIKEPENRLGSVKGAAEIKRHPFFRGLNWALIRCAVPPEVPVPFNFSVHREESAKKKDVRCLEFSTYKNNIDFELF